MNEPGPHAPLAVGRRRRRRRSRASPSYGGEVIAGDEHRARRVRPRSRRPARRAAADGVPRPPRRERRLVELIAGGLALGSNGAGALERASEQGRVGVEQYSQLRDGILESFGLGCRDCHGAGTADVGRDLDRRFVDELGAPRRSSSCQPCGGVNDRRVTLAQLAGTRVAVAGRVEPHRLAGRASNVNVAVAIALHPARAHCRRTPTRRYCLRRVEHVSIC